MTGNVVVLMGGWSDEREPSLASGATAAKALQAAGYQVRSIDVQKRDMGALLAGLSPRPDAVFNALHGCFGEDGCVQGLLNALNIPYTHSGVLASALAMDKPMAKRMFLDAGIAVAEHKIASWEEILAGDIMPCPYVIKPISGGSSIGVHIVLSQDEPLPYSSASWPFGARAMVERFVPGKELTVSVMGDRALGVTEIITVQEFNDYDAKYVKGASFHKLPADIGQDVTRQAMRLAVLAHKTLGCKGVSRADFRFDGKTLFILEVNTQPGITPTSSLPEQAAYAGISLAELMSWMVENAECD